MSDLPTLQEFLEAVEEYDTVDELKQIFPPDSLARYDKQRSKAYDWLKYYSKCGLVALGHENIPNGNFRYRFSLTEQGEQTLEAARDE